MTLLLVVESALRASVLVLGTWGVLRLLRVRSPAQARVLWLGVLVAAAAMPFFRPLAERLVPQPDATAAVFTALAAALEVPRALWPLYLSVAAVLLTRLALGLFVLARLWRTATPVPVLSTGAVRVRSSAAIEAPVTIGAGILLPAGWTRWDRDVRARILTHETSHFMRGDFYWQLLARVYAAVFWASPMSWWVLRRIVLLAEHVSDDAAVAAHGSPADYAALLLQFEDQKPRHRLSVAMARRSDLSRRIERILGAPCATGVTACAAAPRAVALVALLVLVALSGAGPWFSVAPRSAAGQTVLPPLSPLSPLPRLNTMGSASPEA